MNRKETKGWERIYFFANTFARPRCILILKLAHVKGLTLIVKAPIFGTLSDSRQPFEKSLL